MIAEELRAQGYDAVHVRQYDMQDSDDQSIFERANIEDRVIISADTDFGTLLSFRKSLKPSVILFRGISSRHPHIQLRLLLSNIHTIRSALEQGSIVVFSDQKLRVRKLPLLS
jgi:predicted nuclease of predicted toxin-antitoxin system